MHVSNGVMIVIAALSAAVGYAIGRQSKRDDK